jgi:hypothetical protein
MITRRDPEFFFDTAKVEEIRTLWRKIESDFPRTSVLGVTTNPNALAEIGANTSLVKMETAVYSLAQLVTEMRGGQPGGVVNVQIPNSKMKEPEMEEWIKYATKLGDNLTKIAIKLTPDEHGLDVAARNRDVVTNITGVADAQTGVQCFPYEPTYVSLIFGRIRDAGADPVAHFGWAEKKRREKNVRTRIIGGSLRDWETVEGSIKANAVPTIGLKAWDKIFGSDGKTPADLAGLWNTALAELPNDEPLITGRQSLLSGEFFAQMDALGRPLYDEFKSRLVQR